MVIVAGLLICLAFVGLCGAVRECYLKLFVFAGLLIAVLLVSLLVHLFMLPPEEDDDEEGEEPAPSKREIPIYSMTKMASYDSKYLSNYYKDTIFSKKWDEMHRKFRCCGPTGPGSWLNANLKIPYSCCHLQDNSSDPVLELCRESVHGDYVYMKGCPQLKEYPAWKGAIAGNDSDDKPTNVTMVTIIRTAGYFIQFAAVVLAIWLGVLILLSYHCGYY
ncbi:hypothetical protein HHI36_008868 [Cryptolaemus montrouzieri]